MSVNPRQNYKTARQRIKARWRSLGEPCHICGKPIDYSLTTITDPITGKKRRHPMSFVVDEIVPVSRYYEGGYASPAAAAVAWENTRPAHYICNARRGDGRKKAVCMKPLPQPFDDF